jgi:hypothetical protein
VTPDERGVGPPNERKPVPPQDRPSPNNPYAAKPTSGEHPQESHADLGLVEDDFTPDLRGGDS